jgi:hypothetical protein
MSRAILTPTVLALWVLSLAFGSADARAQAASMPTAGEKLCMRNFPYSAEEFLKKLLLVANEADPYTVPAAFEQSFDMKLHPYGQVAPREFIYQTLPTACEWYAQVHIYTSSDLKVSEGVRVQLGMGAIAQPLTFDAPSGVECLSTEAIARILQADGWSARHVEWEITLSIYSKGRTTIEFLPNGRQTPNGPACLTQLTVNYR